MRSSAFSCGPARPAGLALLLHAALDWDWEMPAQALAGQDPSAAVADARRLNPLEPKARALARALRSRSPARRARAAGRLPIPYD